MFKIPVQVIAIVIGLAAVAPSGAVVASNQPAYVLFQWQDGYVGNCAVSDRHTTDNCEFAPLLPSGFRPPDSWADKYLNNRSLPDAPVGKRVLVMFKPDSSGHSPPADAAQAATTELHLSDLQRQYYPRTARTAKLEGHSSADCAVLDDGELDNCWITDETPANAGFGEATLNIVKLMKLALPLPADRKQSFDLTWRIPGPTEQGEEMGSESIFYRSSDSVPLAHQENQL